MINTPQVQNTLKSPYLNDIIQKQNIQAPIKSEVNSAPQDTYQNSNNNTADEVETNFQKFQKWLQAPVDNPQYSNQNSPTMSRGKRISGVLFSIAHIAFIYAIFSKVGKKMSSDGKSEKVVKTMWQNLQGAQKIEDLSLPQGLKDTTDRLIKKLSHPEEILKKGGANKKSILLFGPPGTGKTTYAKALAQNFPNSKFAFIDLSSMQSKWMGETENTLIGTVNEICKIAKENPNQKFFVFFDEIDTIAIQDNGLGNQRYAASSLNALKICLEERLQKRDNIITIAATNIDIESEKQGQKLSSAIVDRFGEKIKVDNPTQKQIQKAIAKHYKDLEGVEDCLKDESSKEVINLAKILASKHVSFRNLNTMYDTAASSVDVGEKVTYESIMKFINNIVASEAQSLGKTVMGFI